MGDVPAGLLPGSGTYAHGRTLDPPAAPRLNSPVGHPSDPGSADGKFRAEAPRPDQGELNEFIEVGLNS